MRSWRRLNFFFRTDKYFYKVWLCPFPSTGASNYSLTKTYEFYFEFVCVFVVIGDLRKINRAFNPIFLLLSTLNPRLDKGESFLSFWSLYFDMLKPASVLSPYFSSFDAYFLVNLLFGLYVLKVLFFYFSIWREFCFFFTIIF